MRVTCSILCAVAFLSCGKSSPCDGVAGKCTAFNAGAKESDISAAFATAQPNSSIAFGTGTFAFTNTLSLAAAGVTIKGAGLDKTTLDFTGQVAGSDAVYVADHSDGFVLRDLTVQNSKGNAVKIIGSTGVTIRNVHVLWTAADNTTHGAYGLYPVACKNVLIENSTVEGASDAGFYVGQSQNIVVRNNVSQGNVAGIEIENSFNADVTGNTATHNTAGILVFDLPGLPQKGGHNVRVFNNQIISNNTKNFAAAGDIVAVVPSGTGSFVMANHDVEFFGNTVQGNNTAGFSVVSYLITGLDPNDASYYPYPARVYAHDNTFSNGGLGPDPFTQLGLLLASGLGKFPGGAVPSILYDDIIDHGGTPGGPANNPMQICFKNNTGATFSDLHLEQLKPDGSNLAAIVTFDTAATTCELPALPAVTLP